VRWHVTSNGLKAFAIGRIAQGHAELLLDAVVPHAAVLTRIAGASVGVVPNLPSRLNRFALSTKLFEYVVLGIPAVVSDLPTLQRYFSPEEVVFFRAGDPEAVVDSEFRVIGTRGLRVVDASVFPRIPGFFIVTPIYMIAEKATDAILAEAHRDASAHR